LISRQFGDVLATFFTVAHAGANMHTASGVLLRDNGIVMRVSRSVIAALRRQVTLS
jgi:hypothetical protein